MGKEVLSEIQMKAWEVTRGQVVKINGEYKLAKEFLYLASIIKECSEKGCGEKAISRGLCKRHYRYRYVRGTLPPPKHHSLTETTLIRFHDGTIHTWHSNELIDACDVL